MRVRFVCILCIFSVCVLYVFCVCFVCALRVFRGVGRCFEVCVFVCFVCFRVFFVCFCVCLCGFVWFCVVLCGFVWFCVVLGVFVFLRQVVSQGAVDRVVAAVQRVLGNSLFMRGVTHS